MGYLHNVYKQYCVEFFHALIPAYAIERLFWQQRGMDVLMVVYCEIVYAVTVAVLEIPSGILADRFGRKRMLCLSAALSVAEMSLILFAQAFWQFALAVFLAGIGHAVFSGSENALIYDSLLAEGKQRDFEKYLGRIRAMDFTGSVIAALSGGVLASRFGFSPTYVISVISMGIAFVITLLLRKPPRSDAPETGAGGMLRYAKQAFRVYRSKPVVLWYCLTGAVLGACYNYLDEFWQLLAEGVGIPVLFFGVLGAVMLGIRIPGNLVAYKLKGKLRCRCLLAGIVFLHAVGYLFIFVLRDMLCLIPILLVSVTSGVAEPLVLGELHRNTPSRVRATAESGYSLGMRGISIVVGLDFGYISTRMSVFAGFLLLAGIGFAYLSVYFMSWKRPAPENKSNVTGS
ncbi:MAG: MFS transporter [Clostridiales bacterium]|nr:MFS transporter [Clostridiales bacterium]